VAGQRVLRAAQAGRSVAPLLAASLSSSSPGNDDALRRRRRRRHPGEDGGAHRNCLAALGAADTTTFCVFAFPWLDHHGQQIGLLAGCHRALAPMQAVQDGDLA
jgi:hypothetical protein